MLRFIRSRRRRREMPAIRRCLAGWLTGGQEALATHCPIESQIMTDAYEILCKHIGKHSLIGPGEAVLAAVSGGADSMCMLLLLERYATEHGIRLGVVTVDHGFRPEARDEAAYVRDFCAVRSIPFYLKEIKPGEIAPTEEAARIRRYELIRETAAEGGYARVALAHNANDRAETMLFNLFRGSGIRGLGSISPKRDIYVRPILPLERTQVEAFLRENGVAWHTDATNLEDAYSRNRIRHHVIPEARGINDGVLRHMYETADVLGEIADHLQKEAARALETAKYADPATGLSTEPSAGLSAEPAALSEHMPSEAVICIKLPEYAAQDRVVRMEMLRLILTDLTPHLKDVTSAHLRAVDALKDARTGASVNLPYDIVACREYDHLCIMVNPADKKCSGKSNDFSPEAKASEIKPSGAKASETKPPGAAASEKESSEVKAPSTGTPVINVDPTGMVPGGEALIVDLPDSSGRMKFELIQMPAGVEPSEYGKKYNEYTKCFDYGKIYGMLTIRPAKDGDRITIDAQGHAKTLNRYMIDAKVPRRMRERIPVLFDGREAMWVTGYRDSGAFRLDGSTELILRVTYAAAVAIETK